jgi:hypothetical protein
MSRKPQPPLTDAQRHDICEMLSSGASRASAAQFAGCHVAALRAEMRRNPDFAARVLQAELNLESTMLRAIRTAAAEDQKQWRAAAWALERIYPNRYAKRRSNTLTVNQVHEFISEVSEIIASELPVPRFRERIFHRLAVLFATARTGSPLNTATANENVPADSPAHHRRIAGPSDGACRDGQTDAPQVPFPPSSEPGQSTDETSA